MMPTINSKKKRDNKKDNDKKEIKPFDWTPNKTW